MNFYLLLWWTQLIQMGSTLQGKNLLLEEQILSFKSRSLLRRGEGGRNMKNSRISLSDSMSIPVSGSSVVGNTLD